MRGPAGIMATSTLIPMDDSGLYRLMAWLSPAFPVGGFSYSHGLEAAVEAGAVTDRASLQTYVATVLRHGAGRADGMLFAATWRAVDAGDEEGFLWAAERAAAMRGSTELALECLSQGAAFIAALRAGWPDVSLAPWLDRLERAGCRPAYPVAVALAAAVASVPLQPALLAYLQAFAAGIVSAGVKLIPLGQSDGQRAVAALEGPVQEAAHSAISTPLEDLGSAAPMIDLWSMQHENQYTRLFRS